MYQTDWRSATPSGNDSLLLLHHGLLQSMARELELAYGVLPLDDSIGDDEAPFDTTWMPGIRPYLSQSTRSALLCLSDHVLREYLVHGQVLHVPFTEREAQQLTLLTNSLRGALDWDYLARYFPGRLPIDLQMYWQDRMHEELEAEPRDPMLFWIETGMELPPKSMLMEEHQTDGLTATQFAYAKVQKTLARPSLLSDSLLQRSFSARPPNLTLPHWLRPKGLSQAHSIYRPIGTVTDSSGSITCIRSFPYHGKEYFISGACVTLDESYNRRGELLICNVTDRVVRSVDAHYLRQSSGQMRQTVTDIQTFPSFGVFLSASYDALVKVWNVETGEALASWRGHKGHIHMLALHESNLLVASASDDGSILCWPIDFTFDYRSKPAALLQKPPHREYNSVGSVYFCPSRHPDWLVSGTFASKDQTGGVVHVFDAPAMKMIACIVDPHNAVSGIAPSPDGHLLAVGGTKLPTRPSSDGLMRLYDLDRLSLQRPGTLGGVGSSGGSSNRPIQTFLTGHHDTDSVFFSPDGWLLASAETTNNEILVFDRRYPAHVLHRLSHDASPEARGASRNELGGVVSHAWCHDSPLLLTSGIDGIIRLWDLSLSDPLLSIYTGFDSSIQALAINPIDTLFAAGTDGGAVVYYSLQAQDAEYTSHDSFEYVF